MIHSFASKFVSSCFLPLALGLSDCDGLNDSLYCSKLEWRKSFCCFNHHSALVFLAAFRSVDSLIYGYCEHIRFSNLDLPTNLQNPWQCLHAHTVIVSVWGPVAGSVSWMSGPTTMILPETQVLREAICVRSGCVSCSIKS